MLAARKTIPPKWTLEKKKLQDEATGMHYDINVCPYVLLAGLNGIAYLL